MTVKKEENGEAQVYATVQEAPRVVELATAKVGPLRKKRKSQEVPLSQAKRSKPPTALSSRSQTSSTACSSSVSPKEAPLKRPLRVDHQQRSPSDRQAHPSSDRQARPLSSRSAKAMRARRGGRSKTPPRKPMVRLTVSASPSPGPEGGRAVRELAQL